MNIARFRTSGCGESEKGWKRLSGWSKTRSGDGAAARPAWVRRREGPCLDFDKAKDVEGCCKGDGIVGRLSSFVRRLGFAAVDFHLRRGARCVDCGDAVPVKFVLSFFRHF